MLPVALAALCTFAAGIPVPETRPVDPFRIERAAACRGVRDGLPFDPGRTFQVGYGRVCVWFGGREGSRATTVSADVWREGPPHRVARCALVVPPRSPGGLFTLGLQTGAPLPGGDYRVELAAPTTRATVRFAVVSGPADVPLASTAPERILSDPAHGFSLAAPAGWEDTAIAPATFALSRLGAPQAVALVLVRHEDTATTAAEVAARFARALAEDVDYLVINQVAGHLGDRRTAALVIDLADGERLKIVVIPREDGPTARTFFGLTLTCSGAGFDAVEPEFDGIVGSFRLLPLSPP